MVVEKYDGTLKAEHGTGRNMAPFVETEWGGEAYEILKLIKDTVDPQRLLNPGVIINEDRNAHIKFLKGLPSVEEEVDRCIECGYCEHKCPSRDITTTPRRRIVIRRILKNLEQQGDTKRYRELLDQYQYDGLDTCAVDGLCATACPVDIDTGDLTKRLRRENHSAFQNRVALLLARNFGFVTVMGRLALATGSMVNKVFGRNAMLRLTGALKRVIPDFPVWSNHLQGPPNLSSLGRVDRNHSSVRDTIVYFPACITRMMGAYPGKEKNALETFMSVCNKVGIDVVIPEEVGSSCCGQIFSSKGFKDAHAFTANTITERLWKSTSEGRYPVVVDVTSCAFTLHKMRHVLTEENKSKFDRLRILDSVDFLHDMVLPGVKTRAMRDEIVLHPVCSLQKMKTEHKMMAVAKFFSDRVVVPRHAGCCGMAGDRGFLFPELTAAATLPEAQEVMQNKYDGYYSSTRTCEIAMSEAVGENYESILYLVDECIPDEPSLIRPS